MSGKSSGLAWVLLAAAMVPAGCGRDPVAELEVAPAEVRLDFPRFVPVEFTWRLLAPAPGDGKPTVFVHLREEGGAVVRTFDHPFPSDWRAGTTVRDEVLVVQSALGPALPPGSYVLTAGLYDGRGRWELSGPGQLIDRGEHVVARVRVAAGTNSVPGFSFSDSWWPEESGGDAQVLAWRWLAGEGTLRVAGTPEAGVLWMRFRLPGPDMAGAATAPGGAPPALHITSACSASEANLLGAGTHDVTLPLPAGAAGAGCEIVLRSNATVPAAAGDRPRSALLEILAWGAPANAAVSAPVEPR